MLPSIIQDCHDAMLCIDAITFVGLSQNASTAGNTAGGVALFVLKVLPGLLVNQVFQKPEGARNHIRFGFLRWRKMARRFGDTAEKLARIIEENLDGFPTIKCRCMGRCLKAQRIGSLIKYVALNVEDLPICKRLFGAFIC